MALTIRFVAVCCALYSTTVVDAAGIYQQPSRGSYKEDAAAAATTSQNQKKKGSGAAPAPPQRRQIWDHDVEDYTGTLLFQESCLNLRPECRQWAAHGGCQQDPVFVLPHCPAACGVCEQMVQRVPRSDSLVQPPREQSGFLVDAVGASLGVPQRLVGQDAETNALIQERVDEAVEYMSNTVMREDLYRPVREICQTYEDQCAYWAVIEDECTKNPTYMNENCAPVCFTCEQLHVESRCPIDPNEKNGAWRNKLVLKYFYLLLLFCLSHGSFCTQPGTRGT